MNGILFIYCAGGVGREVCDIAERVNQKHKKWSEICFIDDTKEYGEFYGKKVINYKEFSLKYKPDQVEIVLANGEPFYRKELMSKVINDRYNLATIIDDSAIISPTAKIGQGVIIYPNVFISSNANIKENALLYNYVTVAHDSIVGVNTVVSINTSIGGYATVGDNCFLAMGSLIRDRIKIGDNTVIGMGAVVCKDAVNNSVYIGNPARKIRENINGTIW